MHKPTPSLSEGEMTVDISQIPYATQADIMDRLLRCLSEAKECADINGDQEIRFSTASLRVEIEALKRRSEAATGPYCKPERKASKPHNIRKSR